MNDDMHRYDKLILVLALVPAAFGALFQGGDGLLPGDAPRLHNPCHVLQGDT